MNWDSVEGKWKQRRGKAVHQWGRIMNDELAAIAGKHEQLVGILQEKYGIAKEEARRQVDEFKKIVGDLKKSNARLMKLKRAPGRKLKVRRAPVAGKKASGKKHTPRRVGARP